MLFDYFICHFILPCDALNVATLLVRQRRCCDWVARVLSGNTGGPGVRTFSKTLPVHLVELGKVKDSEE